MPKTDGKVQKKILADGQRFSFVFQVYFHALFHVFVHPFFSCGFVLMDLTGDGYKRPKDADICSVRCRVKK